MLSIGKQGFPGLGKSRKKIPGLSMKCGNAVQIT